MTLFATIAMAYARQNDNKSAALFLAVMILLLAAGFLVGVWTRRRLARRQKDLAAWAAQKSLRFGPDKAFGLDMSFPDFVCLVSGSDRYACNVAQGEWLGEEFLAFDYHYEIAAPGRGHSYWFSAVILGSDAPLRPLYIRPEGFADHLSGAFGSRDIDFESAEFNRAFYVQSADRKWACDVIHPRVMEFLLSMPRFIIKFGPKHVIVFRDTLFTVEEFQRAAELAQGLLDRMPEYLRRPRETTRVKKG